MEERKKKSLDRNSWQDFFFFSFWSPAGSLGSWSAGPEMIPRREAGGWKESQPTSGPSLFYSSSGSLLLLTLHSLGAVCFLPQLSWLPVSASLLLFAFKRDLIKPNLVPTRLLTDPRFALKLNVC